MNIKVCLIFTPFPSPDSSYVPLGIAYLKSFVKKSVSSLYVKNFDLSNNFAHNLRKKEFLDCLLNLCKICPKRSLTCKGIFKKKDFYNCIRINFALRDILFDSQAEEFYDINKFNKVSEQFTTSRVFESIFECINIVLKHYLEFCKVENESILETSLFREDVIKITSQSPKVIGFSVFSANQLYYSFALAKILKRITGAKIVFGGAYISHLDKKQILRAFNFIDFIIYKEGELGFSLLLKKMKDDNFDSVPNLVYRKGNAIIENKESVICNLDKIPYPEFSDFKLREYFTSSPVLSTLYSRGCFWGACTFCAHHKTYAKPYRVRSIRNLTQELKHYYKIGIKHILFADETIKAKDLDQISKALIKEKINMYFGVMARPTIDFTPEILQKMYKAGFRILIWGVESSSQRVLDLMNKGTNIMDIIKVLKNSSRAGLSNRLYLIQGFPTQTEKEILEDRKFLDKYSKYIYGYAIHNFWIEEGTHIFYNYNKYGLRKIKKEKILTTKDFALYSHKYSFINKERIDLKRVNALLKKIQVNVDFSKKNFNDLNWENLLLRHSH